MRLSTSFKRPLLHNSRMKQKKGLKWYTAVLLWLLLLLIGFRITRFNVKYVEPPAELLAVQTIPASEEPTPPPSSVQETIEDDWSELTEEELLDALENVTRTERYQDIEISRDELHELASVVLLESSTQSMRGQQAVAEVVLNRVIAHNFPDHVHDVLYDGFGTQAMQFSTAPYIFGAEPTYVQYEAVKQALEGPSVLPEDVVFFSKGGENEYVWEKIEDHVFCYQYPWAMDEDKVQNSTSSVDEPVDNHEK